MGKTTKTATNANNNEVAKTPSIPNAPQPKIPAIETPVSLETTKTIAEQTNAIKS